jgi:2-polyprenyl-6-methoxyphenol hydroxylase-like FAD-dependent oxidoreductase
MRSVDVAVIGGGPVGCVSALAHARRGAKVAVLEASGEKQKRFAGELLHPVALDTLRAVGVDVDTAVLGANPGMGFAVFSPELGEPVRLAYPGRRGFTAHFGNLVQALRDETANTLAVRYMPRCKVKAIEGQVVHFERPGGSHGSLQADRIVGADGRFSMSRRSMGLPTKQTTLSHMAGLTLRGVQLPHEGYGHVVLGGPGPALVYRIDDDSVRVCLDTPVTWRRSVARSRLLWEGYQPVLPEVLRAPIRTALENNDIQWAVNGVRPRTHFGRPGLCLVGDAAGHFHPMTAAGMTLGFTDAMTLAASDDFETWQHQRRRDSETMGLLATALYEIFAVDSAATAACRSAIFDMWTSNPDTRTSTIDFLSADDTRRSKFFRLGVELVTRACAHVASTHRRPDRWLGGLGSLRAVGGLLHWLAHETVPASMRYQLVSTATTPFQGLREAHTAQLALHAIKLAD